MINSYLIDICRSQLVLDQQIAYLPYLIGLGTTTLGLYINYLINMVPSKYVMATSVTLLKTEPNQQLAQQ